VIPRIIHQVWLGETDPEPPQDFAEAAASWRNEHPTWEYRAWSGSEVDALFATARPELLPLYRGYHRWVQRADAARYLVLFLHGGLYADHDIVCRRPFDGLLDAPVVLAPTRPVGVSNDLMAFVPGHPLMAAVLNGLPVASRRWDRAWLPPYLRVMGSTGPLHLTRVHRRVTDPGVRLLTPDEYGNGDPEKALVRHRAGGSWHGWDGRMVASAWSHLRGLPVAGAVTTGASALLP
jgi:mannosyltransferase OCH1-like enzyme